MANPWFRMYSEFATDPKVQSMSEAMQRRLMMLFCLRCSDVTVTLCDEELAFALRISDEELAQTKALFLRKGFIDESWDINNWDKRQYSSDSSAARTAAYRERKKQERKDGVTSQSRHGDALDTDTDTDTEHKKTKQKNEYPDWFEDLWKRYPSRMGGNDKRKAFHAANARLSEGKTTEYLSSAVDRYRLFAVATNKINTEYTLQAATFFGPGGHIDNPWLVAPGASGRDFNGTTRSTRNMTLVENLTDRSWAD
jgi:hypothetical protein